MMLTKQHFTSTESSSPGEDPTPEADPVEGLHIGISLAGVSEVGEGTVEVPDHIADNFDRVLSTNRSDDRSGPDFTATLTFGQSEKILGGLVVLYDGETQFRMWIEPPDSGIVGRSAYFKGCIVTDMECVTDARTDEDVVKVDVAVKHAW